MTITYKVYRDAVSGHFVTAEYAHANPSTTVEQTITYQRESKGQAHV